MIWKNNGSSVEIRTQGQLADGRPAHDEIVADGAKLHLEQMSHDRWWMGFEKNPEKNPGQTDIYRILVPIELQCKRCRTS